MPLTQTLHRISTNVRFFAGSLLLPEFAAGLAERVFLTPPKPRPGESAFFDFLDARASYVEHRGRHLASWRWGPADAPAVLLAHGWGGHAAQMRGFVAPLLAAGYRVIAYDQPAHGMSEGRVTGLPDFAEALAAVARHHGGVHGIVAHSLGAAGAAVAIARAQSSASRGLTPRRVVLIGAPSDFVGYTRQFARWHWMPERLRGLMQAAIEERFGVAMAELELARLAPRLRTPALLIHDLRDPVAPWAEGARVAGAGPGARRLPPQGRGPGRILESAAATRAAADFISGRSDVAPLAEPALPNPAPLY
ncbi:MAG: alpha/beta fold hydrolase [Pseudomonadota bacterium]